MRRNNWKARVGHSSRVGRGEWHAFRQYAGNVTGPAANRLLVWFEPDLLPGYAWSFPLPGNRVNIGFGVLRDGERRVQDMASLWRDLLARPHVVEALGSECYVHVSAGDDQRLTVKCPEDVTLDAGEPLGLRVAPGRAHLFDAAGRALSLRGS